MNTIKSQTLPPLPAAGLQSAVSSPDRTRLPRHLAVILDGNGRWASSKGLPRPAGHVRGVEAVRELVANCLERGIEVLSLYAFSSLNWKRPAEEVAGLMRIFQHYLEEEVPRLVERGVRFRMWGERSRLPEEVRGALERAEARSASGTALRLNLGVNYGGREELVGAMRELAGQVARGELDPEEIDAGKLEARLYSSGLPPVDLLIRTAGERRLSNFLLWQSAYAELLFLDVLWPDFTAEHLEKALADFAGRKRTFGGLVEEAKAW